MPILEADKIYLFSQFAEFSQPPDEILAELGYQWRIQPLDLPRQPVSDISHFQYSLERRIQLTPLTSEQARRDLITQDLNLYRVPTDLGDLMEILLGILTSPDDSP